MIYSTANRQGILVSCLSLMTLTGCSNFPQDNRSAEQLRADKSVQATCSTAIGPGYSGRTVQLKVDSTVIQDGTVGVDTDCRVTFANIKPARAASAP
jgi:hypothetical protein